MDNTFINLSTIKNGAVRKNSANNSTNDKKPNSSNFETEFKKNISQINHAKFKRKNNEIQKESDTKQADIEKKSDANVDLKQEQLEVKSVNFTEQPLFMPDSTPIKSSPMVNPALGSNDANMRIQSTLGYFINGQDLNEESVSMIFPGNLQIDTKDLKQILDGEITNIDKNTNSYTNSDQIKFNDNLLKLMPENESDPTSMNITNEIISSIFKPLHNEIYMNNEKTLKMMPEKIDNERLLEFNIEGKENKILSFHNVASNDAQRNSQSNSQEQSMSVDRLNIIQNKNETDEQFQALTQRVGFMIGKQLLIEATQGHWDVQFQLHPKELGKIDVHLQLHEHHMDAQFYTSSSYTQGLLTDGMDKLRETVGNSGIDLANVWVNDFSNSRQQNKQNQQNYEKDVTHKIVKDNVAFSSQQDNSLVIQRVNNVISKNMIDLYI